MRNNVGTAGSIFIAVIVFAALAVAGSMRRQSVAGIPPKPPEYSNPSPEALARRARSEALVAKLLVPVNRNLPVIASEKETNIRSKDAVVDRAFALMFVAGKAEGAAQVDVNRMTVQLGVTTFFSPDEKRFIADANASEHDKTQFVWRYAALEVILWSLGEVPDLSTPNTVMPSEKTVGIMMKDGGTSLRGRAKLRSAAEILDAADLIYRYNWACVDARVNRKPKPPRIDCEVVVERHYALNWLIGYQGKDWDDVSTDT